MNDLLDVESDQLIYSAVVYFLRKGKTIVSVGEICELLGVDKLDIPSIYYNEYYELVDKYKQNPRLGLDELNNC